MLRVRGCSAFAHNPSGFADMVDIQAPAVVLHHNAGPIRRLLEPETDRSLYGLAQLLAPLRWLNPMRHRVPQQVTDWLGKGL